MIITASDCSIEPILAIVDEADLGSDGRSGEGLPIVRVADTCLLPEGLDKEEMLEGEAEDEEGETHAAEAGVGYVRVHQAKA